MVSNYFEISKKIGFINLILLLGYILNPLSLGFLIGYLLTPLIYFHSGFIKKNLDFNYFLLLFFCLTYSLAYSFDPIGGLQLIALYLFIPPALYLWGKFITASLREPEDLYYLLVLFGVILSLPALISVMLNIIEGGFRQSSRSIPLFWSTEPINATGMAAMFLLNMCIPSILLTCFNRLSLLFKGILAIIFVLSILCILRLGSRTQIVIMLATTLASIIILIPRQSSQRNAILFIGLGLITFLLFRNITFDWDADWLSSFAGRMEKNGGNDIATGGGRTDRWTKSIYNIFEKPMGWNLNEFGYSHNLWFDVLRVGGIVSFALLIIWGFQCFNIFRTAYRANPNLLYFNVLILNYSLAFLLLFMVEPIIDGSFYLLAISCLFFGILKKYSTLN